MDSAPEVTSQAAAGRLATLGQLATRCACLYRSDRAQQFLAEWQQAHQNPGG